MYSGPTYPNESVGTASPTQVVPRALDWNCLAHSRLWSACRHQRDGGYGDDAGPEPQSRRLRHTRCRDPLAKPRPDCYRHLANPFAESPEAAGLVWLVWNARRTVVTPPPQAKRLHPRSPGQSVNHECTVCGEPERVGPKSGWAAVPGGTLGLTSALPEKKSCWLVAAPYVAHHASSGGVGYGDFDFIHHR